MQKCGAVKFHKDRVEMQVWGKPTIFGMSVHNKIPDPPRTRLLRQTCSLPLLNPFMKGNY